MTTRILVFVSLCCAIMGLTPLSPSAFAQEKRPTPSQTKTDEEEAEQTSKIGVRQPGERQIRMEMGFRYWFVKPQAIASVDNVANVANAGGSAVIDLARAYSPEFRSTMQITRSNRLRVDFLQMATRADGADLTVNLPGELELSRRNIDIDSLGRANLDVKQLRIGYSWQGFKIGKRVRFGPMIEGRGLLFDGDYTEVTTGAGGALVTDRKSGLGGGGALTLGVDANVMVSRRIEVAAVVTGLPIIGLGRVFDVDTEAKFSLSRNFYVSTAYRYLRFRADSNNYRGELRFQGPAIGAGFRF